jgi:hypothetical protein
MIQFILSFFSIESLSRSILRRQNIEGASKIQALSIWQTVFNRTPELKDFLKAREIELLKASALQEKSKDFILGQIMENRLWQKFDVPMASGKVEEAIGKDVAPIPNRDSFLGRWRNGVSPAPEVSESNGN